MVRLSAPQEKYLKKLRDAKEAYDTALRDLDTEMRVRREAAKRILVPIVKEALDAAIPARQVAIKGLGYADVGSLKQYMVETTSLPTWEAHTVVEAAKPRVGEYPVRVEEIQGGVFDYLITDTFGEEFEMGGMGAREGMAIILFAKDVDTHTDGPEIRAAIDEYFDGKVDWH